MPYKDSETIKAELRVLTEATKKLRQELRALVVRPGARATSSLLRSNARVATPVPMAPKRPRPTKARKKH